MYEKIKRIFQAIMLSLAAFGAYVLVLLAKRGRNDVHGDGGTAGTDGSGYAGDDGILQQSETICTGAEAAYSDAESVFGDFAAVIAEVRKTKQENDGDGES